VSHFRSALYRGKVRHTRLRPVHHDFEYSVFFGLFDIDELDRLDQNLRLFSHGRFNLLGFDPADHGPDDGSPIRPWIEDILADAGVEFDGGRIELLALPRILGYVFNPISVWYGYDRSERLRAVIHEVRNTFGDRHLYVVPIRSEDDLTHEFDKHMHVSPFNPMDQSYAFTMSLPGDRAAVGITHSDADGVLFRAGLRLSRLAMSDRNLARLFVTHPLLTLKVVGAIHWQALRLWLKGAKFHRRPTAPRFDISVVDSRNLTSS
jgi:DUF1365 family protein